LEKEKVEVAKKEIIKVTATTSTLNDKVAEMQAALKLEQEINEWIKSEDVDDMKALPKTADILNGATKTGYLEKKNTGMLSSGWKGHFCILKDAYFFWCGSEKSKEPDGMIKILKPSVKVSVSDSIMTIIDPGQKKDKEFNFRAQEDGDEDVDNWWMSFKQAKMKVFQKKKADAEAAGKTFGQSEKPNTGTLRKGDTMSAFSKQVMEMETELKNARDLLTNGATFINKHRKGQERIIYAPNTLDRLLWAEKKKEKVKGFLMLNEITDIIPGKCKGSWKEDRSFTLTTSGDDARSLELEASSVEVMTAWVRAIKVIMKK